MSQQTNAGFNAPGFSVVADDPCGASPCAAAASSRFDRPDSSLATPTACDGLPRRGSPSFAVGVGQQAIT
jgi:hypothetical protein